MLAVAAPDLGADNLVGHRAVTLAVPWNLLGDRCQLAKIVPEKPLGVSGAPAPSSANVSQPVGAA